MDKYALKEYYETACDTYLQAFCDKHEYESYSWVTNDVGTIACIADYYYVNLDDIRIDIDNDAPLDEFDKWYDYCLTLSSIDINIPTPNYENWLKGCPRKSEEAIRLLKESNQKIENAKRELEELINAEFCGF